MLAWTIYLSFAGALLCLLTRDARTTRGVALGTALGGLLCALAGALQFKPVNGLEVIANSPWVPALGINYSLAADGISVTLVVLTGLAAVAGVLFSWNVERRTNEFFAYFFALIGGVYGVFLSLDLFLLFVFYEIAIVPKYFLIAIWGSTRREYAAMKLALYSFIGSGMVLVGMLAAYAISGLGTFDLRTLAHHAFTPEFQQWAFPLVFVGFAILAGMWPFHTWAPDTYQGAPTPVTAFLSVASKAAGFAGLVTMVYVAFPAAKDVYQPFMWVLAAVTMTLGNLVALRQTNIVRMLAYSSISQGGFILMPLTVAGTGDAAGPALRAVLVYLLLYAATNLGIFAVIIAVSRKTRSGEISSFGGLFSYAPGLAVMMTIFLASLAGIPPLGGWIGKFSAFQAVLEAGTGWAYAIAIVGAVNSMYASATCVAPSFARSPASSAAKGSFQRASRAPCASRMAAS